ncbi:hypothetical protein HOP50_07g49200 [Chloropicon primus]|uniref:F-box domain-containing protein n=2 Tax=Chloropicon primus TaxID=1764295 RepID=A0A5B8MPW0_9CHLO|nr:hypothetical protein A3770_07p48990 [Chloropicon primus]UPR01598.1 hypothetical protein HOP50_07g49200 [Chloropicon primus]|eukprot:QDZ22381.1 hypothetical protein A3770_07p48990 [Chloropicon primus]
MVEEASGGVRSEDRPFGILHRNGVEGERERERERERGGETVSLYQGAQGVAGDCGAQGGVKRKALANPTTDSPPGSISVSKKHQRRNLSKERAVFCIKPASGSVECDLRNQLEVLKFQEVALKKERLEVQRNLSNVLMEENKRRLVLPMDVWIKIIGHLNKFRDLLPFSMACKHFHEVWKETEGKKTKEICEERRSLISNLVELRDMHDRFPDDKVHLSSNYLEWLYTFIMNSDDVPLLVCSTKFTPTMLKVTLFFNLAARHGDLKVINWLSEKLRYGCCEHLQMQIWGEDTCSYAARGGHLHVIKWLMDEGCPWNNSACAYAARGGHVETLKWMKSQGCPWNESMVCYAAARGGHLRLLKWQRSNGSEWSQELCEAAAYGGHLETLKWLKSEGCPWNTQTCASAAEAGHLEVLIWARCQGCPWDKSMCRKVAHRRGHTHVTDWIGQ